MLILNTLLFHYLADIFLQFLASLIFNEFYEIFFSIMDFQECTEGFVNLTRESLITSR